MRYSLILAALILSHVASASELHIVHCAAGCPAGAPQTNDLIIRQIYALSTNDTKKFADWAAYKVTRETIATSADLNRNWAHERYLDDDERLEEDDFDDAYKKYRYDRGHLAPLASFAGTVFWRDTNILSNIAPQKSDLNRYSWKFLETAVRNYAHEKDAAYILTGPLYDGTADNLPQANESHEVPTGFWKVVADGRGGVSAFVFEQDTPRDAHYCEKTTTLADIENRTKLTLFPAQSNWPKASLNRNLGC